MNLLKTQNPSSRMYEYTNSIKLCFATIGVCVFYALTSVGAFFILMICQLGGSLSFILILSAQIIMKEGIILKNTLKGYLIGALSTVMLLGCVAYAASNTKTIEAFYNNIKIYVDGVKINPKDANGKTVEPFIYNGTTYLPVRGIAQAMGAQVEWDGKTNSVKIFKESQQDLQYLLDVCPPYDTYDCKTYIPLEGKSFSMAGVSYGNGLYFNEMFAGGYALFNLNGKYKEITCTIGHTKSGNKDKTVRFIVDGKLVKEVKLEKECMPKTVTVPLNYGLQLKIFGNNNYAVGIGNIIVN